MGLESATYLSSLVESNPTGADGKSQGDDHLRLIKTTLKNTFPNASKPFRVPSSLALQTGDYTVNGTTGDGLVIPISAEAAARTVTLPASPAYDGFSVRVVKADHSGNLVTIAGNGNNINGASLQTLYQRYQSGLFVWCSTLAQWMAQIDPAVPIGTLAAGASTSAPSGWVRANGLTIGNGASSATERANADTLGLFAVLWNSFSDSVCPVTGGRGGSAATDFGAGKSIATPDLRGRALFGRDTMGASAASRLTNAISNIDTNGSSGGAGLNTLLRSDLPNVSVTTSSDGTHTHFMFADQTTTDLDDKVTASDQARYESVSGTAPRNYSITGTAVAATLGLTSSGGLHAHSFNLNNNVTQTLVNNLPPAWLTTWFLKV